MSPGKKNTAKKKKVSRDASKPADQKTESNSSTRSKNKHPEKASFPVVGIGASAGGLEAISHFLEKLPPDLGMAYIYVQHLSRSHESFLPQILQRKTKMPVIKVADNLELQKDHVYVMPPESYVFVAGSKLRLKKRGRGDTKHPVDEFLVTLAEQYNQNAIGIILSGTGSDGALGLRAIKAEGGITFAQDISAHYEGMPQHAAEMGYVDFVMPPEKIVKELASLIQHPYAVSSPSDFLNQHKQELKNIHLIMHHKRGVDFSHYKQTTIHRRIMRRMALHRLKTIEAYAKLLKDSKTEVDALYQDLLITVTNFFRDEPLYEALAKKLLPTLIKSRKPSEPIRIWIPGCATGEEAVSFAIILLENMGEKAFTIPVQIFATDLNEKAIEKARTGIYPNAALHNVSSERLRRFFVKTNGDYQVIKIIRDMCIYAPHNLLKDPPFSRIDVISCQNVLIYLESVAQNKIMHSFHYALKPDGFLLLGKSETIGNATDLFEQSSKEYKIYTKKQVQTPLRHDFYTRYYGTSLEAREENATKSVAVLPEPDLEKETDKLLLSKYVPPSVLVNKDLEIVRFRGATSKFIEPATGKASLNLLKMVHQDLVFEIRTLVHRSKKDQGIVRKEGIILNGSGIEREIAIEVVPIKNGEKQLYFLILFQEQISTDAVKRPVKFSGRSSDAHEKRIASLEAELKEARDSIKILTEDFEATREELQSANEEVLSSNEELQSINEELETSKEELQSTNEELTTINQELQTTNNELKEAGDYARAIVETMHESLLILTGDLKIKSANKGYYGTFHVTADETEGMYLYELGNRQWDIPELKKQLKMAQTLNLPFSNFEVTQNFPVIGWKTMLVNGDKFPTKEGKESMILLAIQDITQRKQMEETLKENEERFRLLIQNASDIIIVFDQDGTIRYESPAVGTMLGYNPEERIGRNMTLDPIVHPDDRENILNLLQNSINNPGHNIYGEFRLKGKDGKYHTIDAIFRNLLQDKKINGIIATYRDVTERKHLENQKDEFIGIASHELKTPVTSIKAYTQILQESFIKARDEKAAALLGKLNNQVDRLTGLITDLLDFTRFEGGKMKFRVERYNSNELIRQVIEEMQPTARDHKIEAKLGKAVILSGDKYRTGQVLMNFISNAIKYSPGGKKIIVRSKLQKENIIISVQDFGIGIEEDNLDKVFNRFFRISQPTATTFPGLGLGLYIASEIVKRQGGRIWVERNVDSKGSVFYFSLPFNSTLENV